MNFRKRIDSFRFAFRGLAVLFGSQPNARIHLTAAVLVLMAGFYFSISAVEWALVLACIAAVISLEAVNTALEMLTDLVSPDYHPLAGKAKDVAAAAVLIAAIASVAIALLIFLPKMQL